MYSENYLNRTLQEEGSSQLLLSFEKLAKFNRRKAVEILNDESLNFSTLYLLRSKIKKYRLASTLHNRNKNALTFIDKAVSKKNIKTKYLLTANSLKNHGLLKWMLESGSRQDGLDDAFDEIIDITSLILVKQFKDKSVIPAIIRTIYNRRRKGMFMQDLAWTLFEYKDPDILKDIAFRLCSADPKDVKLSRELISYLPCIRLSSGLPGFSQYNIFLSWFEENRPFIYYTGESFQQKANPMPYKVSYEAKYLCKPVYADSDKHFKPSAKPEEELLKSFGKLDANSQILLSNYSYRLFRQNPYAWNTWRSYPLGEQTRIAGGMGGIMPW